MKRPPTRDGVAASRYQLPPGPWTTVLDALCAGFPSVDHDAWALRFARGRVLDADGAALAADAPFRVGAEIHYYREVADEPRLPVEERVLHLDAHLLVVDKPHFLPVVPGGGFVRETLLARLVRRTGIPGLAPLHRLDRLTAGLVLFSTEPATRAAYQALFREHRIDKRYEAIAEPLPHVPFPCSRHTRIERGDPFFRMREVDGAPNALTRIDVIERGDRTWRYALEPVTGRKHQLRVQMAAIGAPVLHDPLYPTLREVAPDDLARPLQLLAQSLAFVDPLDGRERRFDTSLSL